MWIKRWADWNIEISKCMWYCQNKWNDSICWKWCRNKIETNTVEEKIQINKEYFYSKLDNIMKDLY